MTLGITKMSSSALQEIKTLIAVFALFGMVSAATFVVGLSGISEVIAVFGGLACSERLCRLWKLEITPIGRLITLLGAILVWSGLLLITYLART